MTESCSTTAPYGNKPKILLVDDEKQARIYVRALLQRQNYSVQAVDSGLEALELIKEEKFDLVLLDLQLPEMDGIEILTKIRRELKMETLPVAILTSQDDLTIMVKCLNLGADDFISKAERRPILEARVQALLRTKRLQDELAHLNRLLSDKNAHLNVLLKTEIHEKERITVGLIHALERVNAYHDTDLENHLRRTCLYSETLALELGLPAKMTAKIHLYASLHDVGKIGVPDSILQKPGKLTSSEWEMMKKHSEIGHDILRIAGADPVAMKIARNHHERFDGNGYPDQLTGEEIPIEARIVALADVYDALTTARVYNDIMPENESAKIIMEGAGSNFDQMVVEAFLRTRKKFIEIRHSLLDGAA